MLHYQPKEHQFVRAYTRSYPNLATNSTQRSESYHYVIKSLVNRQMPPAESVHRIKDHIKQIGIQYDEEINKQRAKVPRLLDKVAISEIKRLITWHALGKSTL